MRVFIIKRALVSRRDAEIIATLKYVNCTFCSDLVVPSSAVINSLENCFNFFVSRNHQQFVLLNGSFGISKAKVKEWNSFVRRNVIFIVHCFSGIPVKLLYKVNGKYVSNSKKSSFYKKYKHLKFQKNFFLKSCEKLVFLLKKKNRWKTTTLWICYKVICNLFV